MYDNHKGQALWELFTSECSHLATLNLLCDPFKATLTRVCASNDVRTSWSNACEVNVKKLFGNVEDLRSISRTFAGRLEDMLVPGRAGAIAAAEAGEFNMPSVIAAVHALQQQLLAPEMQYVSPSLSHSAHPACSV
jgi:hypothetical protein